MKLVILGAGGHGKVVAATALAADFDVLGFIDPRTALHGKTVLGVEVIGGDDRLSAFDPRTTLLANGLGSTASQKARQELFQEGKVKGFSFAVLQHPAAIVSQLDVMIGEGSQIMAGAIVQPGTKIGNNVIVNTGAVIDHDCRIADNCHIAPSASLSGNVTVCEGTHIGAGAVVRQGVSIDIGVVVGAGAVVVNDIHQHATVVGVPAKPISQ